MKIEHHGKIIINKNGIIVERNIKVTVNWEQIELIGFTKNVLIIIPKNSSVNVIIEPREDIFNEIKKYTNAKIIMDR